MTDQLRRQRARVELKQLKQGKDKLKDQLSRQSARIELEQVRVRVDTPAELSTCQGRTEETRMS